MIFLNEGGRAVVLENLIIIFAAMTLFGAAALWIGMRLMNVEGTFLTVIAIAALSSLLAVILPLGRLSMPVAQVIMIRYLTDAELWPDAVVIVVIALVVTTLVTLTLVSMIPSQGMDIGLTGL